MCSYTTDFLLKLAVAACTLIILLAMDVDSSSLELPSLESLCLSHVRGNLEHFPMSQLSLLPFHLRQRLLYGLPAADVCKFEEFSTLFSGTDFNSIWQTLLDYFDKLLFQQTPCCGRYYGPSLEADCLLSSSKDNFLATVGKLAFLQLTSIASPVREYFKHGRSKLVAAFLFGFPSTSCGVNNSIAVPTSGNFPIHVPVRYAKKLMETKEDIAETISLVLEVFHRGPKVIQLCCDELIDKDLFSIDGQVLAPFLRQVEYYCVFYHDYTDYEAEPYYKLLQEIITAQTSVKKAPNGSTEPCLHTLRLEGVHTMHKVMLENLKESCLLSHSSHHRGVDWTAPVVDRETYTKLKRFELEINDSHHKRAESGIECKLRKCSDTIAAILYSQKQLETVSLCALSSIDLYYDDCIYLAYCDFESTYYVLPMVVSRPTFKSLKLDGCSMPSDAAQRIVRTFLCTPTTHAQSLDLSGCPLYKPKPFTLPKGFPNNTEITEKSPCVNCDLKSLSLYVNNGQSSYTWLLDHTQMNLRHLKLFCNPTTTDLATRREICEPHYYTDELDSDDEEYKERSAKRQRLVVNEEENEELSLKNHVEKICDFICKLKQPESLEVHVFSKNIPCIENHNGFRNVRALPNLRSLSVEKQYHWSIEEENYKGYI